MIKVKPSLKAAIGMKTKTKTRKAKQNRPLRRQGASVSDPVSDDDERHLCPKQCQATPVVLIWSVAQKEEVSIASIVKKM